IIALERIERKSFLTFIFDEVNAGIVSLQNHTVKLVRQFLFTIANHNSRVSICRHGVQSSPWFWTRRVYPLNHDFIKFSQDMADLLGSRQRLGKHALKDCLYYMYETHLKNAPSNKRQMLTVIAGPQSDSQAAVDYFKELQNHGIRNRVFGIFAAQQEPNLKNFGDPEPFMINGIDGKYPRDLAKALTELERMLTRGHCTPND
ncbi:hypothetical protein ANCCAN_18760, partial [Ancylostoma caninum]